ncbi:MAG TPA: endonuclease/exonuclease/phosphatase family protein [Pyrinomonadaceae bacterium]|nr:endonuclease/exonuclease/phosphatase family protein [Pyrinomonadaceae bacterium]
MRVESPAGGRRRSPRAAAACALVLLTLLLPSPLSPAPVRAQQGADGGERLLEVSARRGAAPPVASGREVLKVVSYNIRWRGGDDLRELIRLLREDPEIGGADIIGLQEVDRDKRRTKNTNTARLIAEELGLNYAWAAPPTEKGEKEEETGVALFSPHPLSDVSRLVLPHEGPNGRRRAAVGATVLVGDVPVRAYSVHAETRMPLEKKVEHWRAVLEDAARHPQVGHAVVVGDFNTIKGKDVRAARKLFADAGFTTPFPDDRSTWRTFVFDLKLDWLWLRGFEHAEHGIDKQVGLSDHWPLWATVKLRRAAEPPAAAGTN